MDGVRGEGHKRSQEKAWAKKSRTTDACYDRSAPFFSRGFSFWELDTSPKILIFDKNKLLDRTKKNMAQVHNEENHAKKMAYFRRFWVIQKKNAKKRYTSIVPRASNVSPGWELRSSQSTEAKDEAMYVLSFRCP